ncbi:MAG: membrane protein insertase YidC [Nitrosomonadaceae bacterium]|nr:membrane protein insertase YidC [Nitrosomonadaceae bacterium]|tara:strand:- start:4339 stop:6066 length:1728 start_codon:yes stop_codon:yes gene_type:complete
MDIKKLVLIMIFFTSGLFLWEEWRAAQQNTAEQGAVQQGSKTAKNLAQQGIGKGDQAQDSAPIPGKKLISSQQINSASSGKSNASATASTGLESGTKIVVKTDMVVAVIDTAGGDIRNLDLLNHPSREDKSIPFSLLQSKFPRVNVAQSGLIGEDLPTHKTHYTAESENYTLSPGEDKIEIRLFAPEAAGIKATKIYTFHRGSYVIDVKFEIENQGSKALQPFSYFQVLRDIVPVESSMFIIPQYSGPTVYTEAEKFQKIKFEDLAEGIAAYPKNTDNGWIAMQEHYFLTAWLPDAGVLRENFAKHHGGYKYSAGVIVPAGTIQPGEIGKVEVPFYVGPQEQSKLAALSPGLDLVVDYGWLTVIGAPLFWLLSYFHSWTGNWGVAIILLTMLVKLIFFPLSAAGYRSMAKLKAVAPRLQKLREQHKGKDKQVMNQAMMEFYKTEKINPMGGCLPILVQIPIFISLYWVLLASVELRYAPFALWIQDLSMPDPYYVLPVIMGISMYIQTKLNPAATDPIQQKVMQIMPLVFSVFFFFFPAGLVLYSLVNNTLSIAQQWQITRMYAPSPAVPANKKK